MKFVIRLVGGSHCGVQFVIRRGKDQGPPTHLQYEDTVYVISRYVSKDTLLYDSDELDFTSLYKD